MAKRHINRLGDLHSLFLRLEELVLANSGEDEFEEIFKLLIAKLWDERCGKKSRFKGLAKEIDTWKQVVKLLREAEKFWPGIVEPGTEPALTPEHLQVCVEALEGHTVSDNALEVMDGFFEFLVSRETKGSKGQYFTPRYVIEFCVRMMKPQRGELILDPACGSGGFLLHALHYLRDRGDVSDSDLTDYCSRCLWGFDIDGRAVRVAKALMMLAGNGQANVLRLNSLIRPEMTGLFAETEGREDMTSGLTVEDVCRSRLRHHRGFDLILTNPPFAGEVRERQLLDGYALASGKSRVERDVLFIERCIQLLCPGGRMAIVLPHNKLAAATFTYAREWLSRQCQVIAVVGLGRNTFLPHTHQKASVLFVRKRKRGERPAGEELSFFAVSEKDGKDSKGRLQLKKGCNEGESPWERVDHDFDEIVTVFSEFSNKQAVLQEA